MSDATVIYRIMLHLPVQMETNCASMLCRSRWRGGWGACRVSGFIAPVTQRWTVKYTQTWSGVEGHMFHTTAALFRQPHFDVGPAGKRTRDLLWHCNPGLSGHAAERKTQHRPHFEKVDTHTQTYTYTTHTYIHTDMYTHAHHTPQAVIHTHTHTHRHIHTHTPQAQSYIYTHTHHRHSYTHTHTTHIPHTHTNIHTHTHRHIYTHTPQAQSYIHIHTHTRKSIPNPSARLLSLELDILTLQVPRFAFGNERFYFLLYSLF